ncbi:MAG: hypothetical protein ACHQ51_04165 [Elusimicrobiota bacterium]
MMKTNRIGRPGVLAMAVVGVLAASWILPPAVHQARRLCPVRPDGVSEAGAYSNFARRYGVSCSVCHSSYPQLTEVGYKFRIAGYRMPDEIGNDAKWSNWGDNAALRMSETYTAAATKGNTGGSTPETNGFSNSGIEMYPLEGAFGKYVAFNSEVDFVAGKTPVGTVKNTDASYSAAAGTPGQVAMNTMNLLATFPINADSFATVRTGLFQATQGYGASDRGVGNLSPTFKPTPSQVQPGNGTKKFTYAGFAPTGEGIELAYNWKGTHIAAQVLNGYNSFNASANQGEDNHYKDFGLFINQMIGESAIAAYFYNGTTGYAKDASVITNGVGGAETAGSPFTANWYDNYMRGIAYGTIKFLKDEKLDLLIGACDSIDHVYDLTRQESSHTFHSIGWFTTLQSMNQIKGTQLTTALSYGTNRASTAVASNRVSDVTLSFAVPIENNKFTFDLQNRRTQAPGFGANADKDTIANTAAVSWQFMY